MTFSPRQDASWGAAPRMGPRPPRRDHTHFRGGAPIAGGGAMRRTQPLLLLLTLLPACHSSSTADSTAAADQACTLDAQTYCDKRKTCWPEGLNDFRFQQNWGTLEKCVDDRKRTCMADVGRQGSGLGVDRVQTCAMALQAQSCPNFIAGIALPTSACPPVVGQLDDAAACVVSNQCKSNYCDRAEDQLC